MTENSEIAKSISSALHPILKPLGFTKRANSFNRAVDTSRRPEAEARVTVGVGTTMIVGIPAVRTKAARFRISSENGPLI